MTQFETVFRVTDFKNFDWVFPCYGLIVFCVALLLFLIRYLLRKKWQFKVKQIVLLLFIMVNSLIWALTTFFLTYSDFRRFSRLLEHNECKMIIGEINTFNPADDKYDAEESFEVKGIPFSYSEYRLTGSFNKTNRINGPIKNGQTVKICYVKNDNNENLILLLQIVNEVEGVKP